MSVQQLSPARSIQDAISDLDSLVAGEAAVSRVVAFGHRAIPYLERFLLDTPPRTISLPRCRAVRALSALGAYSALIQYFDQYVMPRDAAVLFAEDAVRSVAAIELSQTQSAQLYRVLLNAVRQRATGGLVQALGAFRQHESIPLLFELLEDDFCRSDALAELRKMPTTAQPFAILLLRGCTTTPINGSTASRRRRSTLQLLSEFGIAEHDWPELRAYLLDEDLDCAIAAAQIGLSVTSARDKEQILRALIEVSARMNWAQEMQACELFDQDAALARAAARTFLRSRDESRSRHNWLSPFWRILHHILGNELQQAR
jgi:hypothetical protein